MENTKRIELTKGKFAIVDAEDFEWLSMYKWYFCGGYARRNIPKASRDKRSFSLMHREIIGAPVGFVTDHINLNGLDNRKCNLRVCTRGENICNKKVLANNRLKLKGVRVGNTKSARFEARISHRGKIIFIGQFATARLAAMAYDRLAMALHGEFAQLNFPKATKAGRR